MVIPLHTVFISLQYKHKNEKTFQDTKLGMY